jgi:hypothetical protein
MTVMFLNLLVTIRAVGLAVVLLSHPVKGQPVCSTCLVRDRSMSLQTRSGTSRIKDLLAVSRITHLCAEVRPISVILNDGRCGKTAALQLLDRCHRRSSDLILFQHPCGVFCVGDDSNPRLCAGDVIF